MYEVTNKSTMHGLGTPHGKSTPHKMPIPDSSFNVVDVMADLARQLYPTGRAWWMPYNGVFSNLHKAINLSFVRVVESSNLTLDSIFPDNENFSIEDCILWEYRLGLVSNNSLSLEQRKQAILRKIAYPNNVKARQSRSFIESQLRLAGFDVYVHENSYFDGVKWNYYSPNDITGLSSSEVQHGDELQHGGGTQHGFSGFDLIANEAVENESFSIGDGNLWATFFIGGQTLGQIANVPITRLTEFKELVLKLKPAHLVAVTFINYV